MDKAVDMIESKSDAESEDNTVAVAGGDGTENGSPQRAAVEPEEGVDQV